MELKQLQYFRRAAQKNSISKAAEELYITQPAMSRCIKRLEDEVGTPLLERKQDGVFPTKAGSVFLKELDEALVHLERGLEIARIAANQESPILSIVYSFEDLDLTLVEAFHHDFPDIRTNLEILPPDQAFRELLAGKADFAVIPNPDDHVGICCDHLFTEEVFLSAAEGNPLFQRESVQLSELNGMSCICNEVSFSWKEIENICRDNHIHLTLQLSSNNHQAAGRFKNLMHSMMFIPSSIVYHERPEADTRQLTPPARIIPNVFQRRIYVAYPKDKHMSDAERHFLSLLKGSYRRKQAELAQWQK